MNDSKKFFLAQALFVTFLWSASKIIIKLGLSLTSPFILIAAIQATALVVLLIYYFIKRPVLDFNLVKHKISSLVLIGIVGFAAAPLLSIIGLKYITGTTAGLFASLGALMVIVLGFIILREKPRNIQIIGSLLALVGAYIFLSGGLMGGSLLGILLIVIAELGFALSVVLTRLVVRSPGDETMVTSLVGTGIGTAILVPIGLMTDGAAGIAGILQWQILLVILVVGAIFAFGSLLWSAALDQLQAMEGAILQSTMIIQIAILSIIFLRDPITLRNILGGAVVLLGAYLVERRVFSREKYLENAP